MQALATVSNYIPASFRDPDDSSVNQNIWNVTYGAKKTFAVSATLTELPTTWATVVRNVNDYTLPYFIGSEYSKFGAPLSVAFGVIDVFETLNDIHYFINGGAHEELTKGRICSVVAHILLVPANAIGAALFFRAADLGSTLGAVAVFSYIEKGAHFLQITLIPGVASTAAWLTQEGWVHVVATFGTLADGCLLGAFVMFSFDASQRWYTQVGEAEQCELAFRRLLKREGVDLSGADIRTYDLRRLIPLGKPTEAVALAELKAKWLNHEEKTTQAKRDLTASVSQVAFKGALMVGVANPAALAALGAFAFFAVGTSIYYRLTTKEVKPEDYLKASDLVKK